MIKITRRCTIIEIDQKSRSILTRYHPDDQPRDAAPWDIWSEGRMPVVSFHELRAGMQVEEIIYGDKDD